LTNNNKWSAADNTPYDQDCSELFNLFSKYTHRKTSLDWYKPLFDKHTSYWKIIKQARKITEKVEKFLIKTNSTKLASINRARFLPENATIRKEYVKCGKSQCHTRHGAYYYAYWKEGNTKKLRKKYIGRYIKRDSNKKESAVPLTTSADIEISNKSFEGTSHIKSEKEKERKRKTLVVKEE
jgi:hypothetical protein